jgi:hypothetical protein
LAAQQAEEVIEESEDAASVNHHVREGEREVAYRVSGTDEREANAPVGLLAEGSGRQLGGERLGAGTAGLIRGLAH